MTLTIIFLIIILPKLMNVRESHNLFLMMHVFCCFVILVFSVIIQVVLFCSEIFLNGLLQIVTPNCVLIVCFSY